MLERLSGEKVRKLGGLADIGRDNIVRDKDIEERYRKEVSVSRTVRLRWSQTYCKLRSEYIGGVTVHNHAPLSVQFKIYDMYSSTYDIS